MRRGGGAGGGAEAGAAARRRRAGAGALTVALGVSGPACASCAWSSSAAVGRRRAAPAACRRSRSSRSGAAPTSPLPQPTASCSSVKRTMSASESMTVSRPRAGAVRARLEGWRRRIDAGRDDRRQQRRPGEGAPVRRIERAAHAHPRAARAIGAHSPLVTLSPTPRVARSTARSRWKPLTSAALASNVRWPAAPRRPRPRSARRSTRARR